MSTDAPQNTPATPSLEGVPNVSVGWQHRLNAQRSTSLRQVCVLAMYTGLCLWGLGSGHAWMVWGLLGTAAGLLYLVRSEVQRYRCPSCERFPIPGHGALHAVVRCGHCGAWLKAPTPPASSASCPVPNEEASTVGSFAPLGEDVP